MKPVICHITIVHNAFDTRIFFRECISLSKNYRVVLIAPAGPELSKYADNTEPVVQVIGIKTSANRLNRFLTAGRNAFLIALKQKAQVYHFHDPEFLPWASLLVLLGRKVIYDVHEDYQSALMARKNLSHKNKLIGIYRKFEDFACKRMHLILAERSYISIYQKRAKSLCVVENFCTTEMLAPFKKEIRINNTHLIYIGTIHAERGAETMIEALALCNNKGLNLQLDMVGNITDPIWRKNLESNPEYQKVKHQINWHGRLSLIESFQISEKAFAGFALIDNQPNHSESYPGKIFEYMAVGLPVIASDNLINKGVVERNEAGICVGFADAYTVADAVEKLFSNKTLAQQMGHNGTVAVEKNYNWKSEEMTLLDFYNKIVSQ